MVEIPYPLTTERLVLRRFCADDLDAYYAYQRLPETARYLYGGPRSYVQCMARIAKYVEDPFAGPGDWATFAVERAGLPGLVGELALKWNPGGRTGDGDGAERVGEIGWTLAPGAQGHGYATEAARAVLDLAIDHLGFHRVEARLDARNGASAAICERLGMRREGVLRDNMYLKGEWTSEAIYAVVRS
ncbi:GNAT family N-acetyltransferase [Arthrobacter wenxiniae]|jgi:RimJ/RimL family protein N-acetyltransferase|uniref:GNAT family N-acetyltransferase n=1 Tax=Arthrobacter wenxiniae TaxID=2713570 RepID=A0A7Y7LX31_9MICC|nr:GNAT family protein [Arthrobacter wenxiniae]NVM93457.1 GNAT family N-acetyltransferase [Arthrobacter wenxiniae]